MIYKTKKFCIPIILLVINISNTDKLIAIYIDHSWKAGTDYSFSG